MSLAIKDSKCYTSLSMQPRIKTLTSLGYRVIFRMPASVLTFAVKDLCLQTLLLSRRSRYRLFPIMSHISKSNGYSTSQSMEGIKLLETQVGGHRYGSDARKLGMLDRGNGIVLKAMQEPPRGTREIELYQVVFSPVCTDKDLLELRNFIPWFYGTEERDEVTFLVMNNITYGFHRPNILDLKMGRVTYDPEASPQKQKHEISKYPPLEKIGFQIAGMMVYNHKIGENEKFGKDFCRSITAETMVTEGLGRFFGLHDAGLQKNVIKELISKLKRLENWFLVQKKYAFYASSLLIVYSSDCQQHCEVTSTHNGPQCSKMEDRTHDSEADEKPPRSKKAKLEEDGENHLQICKKDGSHCSDSHTPCSSMPSLVEVKMIDFAHVFPSTKTDENYLFGLQKLITMLEELFNK